jgi:PHS family inorganic phosphate transporter-like MFS transporter
MYDILVQNAKQSIIAVSIGSLLGSLALIKLIEYFSGKKILTWSFLVLAVMLAITGASFFKVFHTDLHALTIILYALCQFLFNFGEFKFSAY